MFEEQKKSAVDKLNGMLLKEELPQFLSNFQRTT